MNYQDRIFTKKVKNLENCILKQGLTITSGVSFQSFITNQGVVHLQDRIASCIIMLYSFGSLK